MKTRSVATVIFICMTAWLQGFSVQPGAQAEYVPGEVLVRFNQETGAAAVNSFTAKHNLQSLDRIATINLYRMKTLADSDVFELSARLSKDAGVAYAEPNFIERMAIIAPTPNDTFYSQQWHYRLLRMPGAWIKSTGGDFPIVAVVDTGVRFDHPDIGSRLLSSGYDFVDLDADPTDPGVGHGTHVAGTIGAVTNNSLGVAGMTWTGKILPVRTIPYGGGGTAFQFSQGFRYAAGLLAAPDPVNPTPAQVINYSGGGDDSETKKEAVAAVNAAGVIMVCAAMNDDDAIGYPAAYSTRYPMVICVGAVDYGNGNPYKAYYSNYGAAMNVVAPGGDLRVDSDGDGKMDGVLSTAWDYFSNKPTYEFYEGTSMATPHVAGLAALMLGLGIVPSHVRSVMQDTATDLGIPGFDYYHGYGLINPVAALEAAPALRITLNNMIFAAGNTIIAQVFKLVNPVKDPRLFELKFWLSAPGIGPVSLLNLGADGGIALPGFYEVDLGPVQLFPVTAQWPRGSYELSSRTVHPVTGETVSEDFNLFAIPQ